MTPREQAEAVVVAFGDDRWPADCGGAGALGGDEAAGLEQLMRDPGTEPLVMISGDVMELHRIIYAEREAHAAEVARYRAALNTLPCVCKRLLITTCPQCGGRLEAVTYPSDSMLNRDQFDSVRAGDWYCTNCKGVEARSGHKYWWDSDLGKSSQQCSRCVALATPPTAAVEAVEGMRMALEEMRIAAGRQECFVCGHELSQHLDKYGCESGVGDPDIGAPCGCKGASTSEDMRPEIEALARADAALAAWKEAIRG